MDSWWHLIWILAYPLAILLAVLYLVFYPDPTIKTAFIVGATLYVGIPFSLMGYGMALGEFMQARLDK